MYVIMCELRSGGVLKSAHPIDVVNTAKDVHKWMRDKPAEIIEHLNTVTDDVWVLSADRSRTHAVVVNIQRTITRTYIARRVT